MRWFSGGGCVIEGEDEIEVTVGGILVGKFERDDIGTRNAVLVGLAADDRMHLGHLARAFGLSEEMLRRIRRRFEKGGLEAILPRPTTKVDDDVRAALEGMFAAGATITEAHRRIRRRCRIGRATVGVLHKEWGRRRAPRQTPSPEGPAGVETSAPRATADGAETAAVVPHSPTRSCASESQGRSVDEISPRVHAISSAPFVQHLGTWLLLAAIEKYGLFDAAARVCAERGLSRAGTRVALDAFATALALGEPCVEGVRRIATPTASVLLRADHAPSVDWVRTTLHRFADAGATEFHLGMAVRYLEASRQLDAEEQVFYVDNHLRPYTGKHTLRRGWRMQDKRVLPGASDYYVHDEDGRPVLRVVAPDHGHLTDFLLPLADTLTAALGEEAKILLAFDRAGAYPEAMAALREESVAFVTYERRPYRKLRPSEFDREVVLEDSDGEPERLRYAEFWIALGKGRGDVKRIAVATEQGRQINLVTKAQTSSERLIAIMRGRWVQENGFKHGVQRWGINQLDGRRVAAYAPQTVIPNPARRRLDNALRLARVDEGLARNELARRPGDDPKHDHFERAVADAIALQKELLVRRATTPVRAPLAETELAGKLVHHVGTYKTVLDTVRVACANAEADLAERLATELPRAAEAKKSLATLFAAPGRIEVGPRTIKVDLAPAGTGAERAAFDRFFAKINKAGFALPGEQDRRELRFRAQP